MSAPFPERVTPEVWARVDAHRRLGPMDAATYREVVGGYDARGRKGYLMLLHPDESPDPIAGTFCCVNPPSRFGSDAKWMRFRDRCVIPMMAADPDHPDWPRYLAQVEAILAWRASIPPEDRFWRQDG